MRDRLARHLCNLIMNIIATRAYRDGVEAAIRRGLDGGTTTTL